MSGDMAKVLAEHAEYHAKRHADDPWKYDGTYVCACEGEFKAGRGMGSVTTAHRTHLAAALLAAGFGDTAQAERDGAVRALSDAADEVRRETRWQYEQIQRTLSGGGQSLFTRNDFTERLLMVEQILRARADRLAGGVA
jgi:hypothetical protein